MKQPPKKEERPLETEVCMRVEVIISVPDRWGPATSLRQVYDQSETSAEGLLDRAIRGELRDSEMKRIRINNVRVHSITTKEEQGR